ncbi:MAG: sugar-binding transcriptional regulator [Caldilineaceae bacterium]|nr:sugar-binding transcriptional regulator [Caldilineaceae bacterium]
MTTEAHLLYKIAKTYYEDGLTQDQIGKRFGLSRIKVSRLLQQARQNGVVQISIAPLADSFADLERELETVFGLYEAVIVASGDGSQSEIVPLLGQAAAAYLARCVEDGQVLDLSWGTTLLATVDAVLSQHLPNMRVVQMLGGLGRLESEVYGSDLALRLAQALGAKMRLLQSPGIVSSKMVRDALLDDVNIAETLALAAQADVALVGIGSPKPGSVVLQAGILSEQELLDLQSVGAVGDIALRFFDAQGAAIDHPINERIIGLTLAQIASIPRVIGVAGGGDKAEVIKAALRGRLLSVLVTDEQTARWLLSDRIADASLR